MNNKRYLMEKMIVKELGEKIGYGNLMDLVHDNWAEKAKKLGQEGSEFAIGPCVAATMACGCNLEEEHCSWCRGSGWLTKHVKAIKDKQYDLQAQEIKSLFKIKKCNIIESCTKNIKWVAKKNADLLDSLAFNFAKKTSLL